MEYVDGGGVALNVSRWYLPRGACIAKATSLYYSGQVKGMSIYGIAKEIFAHAVCYYMTSVVKGLGISSSTVDYLRAHANPINIEDGGDSWKRQLAFQAIWALGGI